MNKVIKDPKPHKFKSWDSLVKPKEKKNTNIKGGKK